MSGRAAPPRVNVQHGLVGMRGGIQIGRIDWRRLLTVLVLVAFSVQSFLIQTHVHSVMTGPLQNAATSVGPQNHKLPFDLDTCVLCQEYLHGGTYLTPSAVAVLPPSAQISLLPFVIAPAAMAKTVSHIWMGRAPPRA